MVLQTQTSIYEVSTHMESGRRCSPIPTMAAEEPLGTRGRLDKLFVAYSIDCGTHREGKALLQLSNTQKVPKNTRYPSSTEFNIIEG